MVRESDQARLAGLQADHHGPGDRRRRISIAACLLLAVLGLAAPAFATDAPPREVWESARAGDTAAQLALGRHHLNRESTDFDPQVARYWLTQAMKGGSAEAATELADLLLDHGDTGEEFNTAMEALAIGVEAGLPRAQFRLASILANGFGIATPDASRARSLYQLAADQGHAPSQAALGVFYFEGIAGERSIERAAQLFRAAAAQGDALGQYHVAILNFAGVGKIPDPAAGLKWLRQAADQKLPQALLALGQMHHDGRRVEKDDDMAVELVTAAAQAGLAEAQLQFGVWRARGIGGAPDDRVAVAWYRRAAEQGNPDAQYLLGNHLASGRGVTMDVEHGIFWLEAAARSGHPDAEGRIRYYLVRQQAGPAGAKDTE